MEKKFTKGEWHVDGHNLCAVISEMGPHNYQHVCTCDYGYTQPEKFFELNKSNAKLIAAAPDLLESLQFMLEWAEAIGYNQYETDFIKAKDALKKALE